MRDNDSRAQVDPKSHDVLCECVVTTNKLPERNLPVVLQTFLRDRKGIASEKRWMVMPGGMRRTSLLRTAAEDASAGGESDRGWNGP